MSSQIVPENLTHMAPKVSVLIPTYNYGRFLDETIQCVLAQTFTDYELVIVDNCSTDNTQELVQKYLSDERVRYHRNDRNIGLVGNWNLSMDLATGTYIKFLCADDKFHPELLEKFVAAMDGNPTASLVTSYCQLFGSKNLVVKKPFIGLADGVAVMKDTLNKFRNWLGEPTAVMFRRADLKLGKMHQKLHSHLDWEFFLRLLTVGDLYVVPEVLYYIRKHDETETAKLLNKRFENVFENYRFVHILKWDSDLKKDQIQPEIDLTLRERAVGCAKLMYKVLPGLHKKENRQIFGKAFRIGYTEGVLLDPLLQLVRKAS